MAFYTSLGCFACGGEEGVGGGERGDVQRGSVGGFVEEEVYGQKVSVGFQYVSGGCGQGAGNELGNSSLRRCEFGNDLDRAQSFVAVGSLVDVSIPNVSSICEGWNRDRVVKLA